MKPEYNVLEDLASDPVIQRALDTVPQWSEKPGGPYVNGAATEHLLSSDNIAFGFTTYQDMANLSWLIKTPDYLSLDADQRSFEALRHFALIEFPQLAYEVSDLNDDRKLFIDNSEIGFIDRLDENDPLFFSAASEDQRARLYEFYSELNTKNTKMLTIVSNRGYDVDRKQSKLTLVYGMGEDDNDAATVSLPMSEFGIYGWTDRIAGWAIRTHELHKKEDDVGVSASELSGTLRKIATNVYLADKQK